LNKRDFVSETERLVIRPYQKNDYRNWLNQYQNRLSSQYKYDEGKVDMSEYTEEWFNDWVEKIQQMNLSDSVYVFGVFRKEDGVHIGKIDISTLIREDFKWAMIGYTINNQFWKNGYGKESVKEALNIAFRKLNFHRIEAHINTDNVPSIRLAESIGMEFECVRKGFIFEFGEWTDNLVYYINSN
jgi:ribosomal-protein-alanine N-acetyltransferase